MSGYPTGSGYPYGAPPPSGQPYGAPPAGPYGGYGPPPAGEKPSKTQQGGGYPSAVPYGDPYAAQYGQPPLGGEKPSKPHKAGGGAEYQPSAPPTAGPYGGYGDPYASSAPQYGQPPPGDEKPSKTQSPGPYGGYSDPYASSAAQYGQPPGGGEKPSKTQSAGPYGGYGDPYGGGGGGGPAASPYGGEKPSQGGGGYQGGYGASPYGSSPFAALMPSAFPPGTDPNIVASFQAADQDGSGLIDDKELQGALSFHNQSFSLRTVHLLMYLFTSSNVRKIGPKEFISVFYSLQSWRGIFERFDRDRSGKIDSTELRDALLSLGFAISPAVLDLLVSKFDKSGGKNKAIEYDGFIECCLTVKGLTEKFKEKDARYTGSATFTYESFMLTVLPFLIA